MAKGVGMKVALTLARKYEWVCHSVDVLLVLLDDQKIQESW